MAIKGDVSKSADVKHLFENHKVESEGTHTAGHRQRLSEEHRTQAPLGRIGQPEDVAKVAVFLASDESAWLTGERISASVGHR